MKQYDVKCPVCGHVNHNLFLEETDGWMECEECSSMSRSNRFGDREFLTTLPKVQRRTESTVMLLVLSLIYGSAHK